jgi:hypothetical protein
VIIESIAMLWARTESTAFLTSSSTRHVTSSLDDKRTTSGNRPARSVSASDDRQLIAWNRSRDTATDILRSFDDLLNDENGIDLFTVSIIAMPADVFVSIE